MQLYSIANDNFMAAVKLVFGEGNTREALNDLWLSGFGTGTAKLLNDDRQFLLGDNVSLADFVLFVYIEYGNQIAKGQAKTPYTEYPKLEAYRNRMATLPGLAEYLAGPHHAERAGIWFPPFAKMNIDD